MDTPTSHYNATLFLLVLSSPWPVVLTCQIFCCHKINLICVLSLLMQVGCDLDNLFLVTTTEL